MTDLVALRAANASRWANAKLTRGPEFAKPAGLAVANEARYLAIARRSGMPDIGWVFIAVSHYRESAQNFERNLGQGDPLGAKTSHIPAGRGPFRGPAAFEDAAVDALVNCAPYAARLTDWSVTGMLTNLERYNGLGYATRGLPSPYIWSGTDQYRAGKYVADGVFDATEVDKQLGCAGLILTMMGLDPSIRFEDSVKTDSSKTMPGMPPSAPPSSAPVHDGAWLQAALNRLGAAPQLVVDGVVGPSTRNAVRAFQLASHLEVDGLVGPATFAALDAALATGKPVPTLPVPPEITLPPPGTKARDDLAPTFWGRVLDLFRPKKI